MDVDTAHEELVALDDVAIVIHLLHDPVLLLLVHGDVLHVTAPSSPHKLTLQLIEEVHQTRARLQDQLGQQLDHAALHALAALQRALDLERRLGVRQDRNPLDFVQRGVHLPQLHLVQNVHHLHQQQRRVVRGGRHVRFVHAAQELQVVLCALRDRLLAGRVLQVGGGEALREEEQRVLVVLGEREEVDRLLPLVLVLRVRPARRDHVELHGGVLDHLLHLHLRQLVEESLGAVSRGEHHAHQLLRGVALQQQCLHVRPHSIPHLAQVVLDARLAHHADQRARHQGLHAGVADHAQQTGDEQIVLAAQQPVVVERGAEQERGHHLAVLEQVQHALVPLADHQQVLDVAERRRAARIEVLGAALLDALRQAGEREVGSRLVQPREAGLVDYPSRPDFWNTVNHEQFVPEPVLERGQHLLLGNADIARVLVDHAVHRVGRFVAQQRQQEQSTTDNVAISGLVHVATARARQTVAHAAHARGDGSQIGNGFRRASVKRSRREGTLWDALDKNGE